MIAAPEGSSCAVCGKFFPDKPQESPTPAESWEEVLWKSDIGNVCRAVLTGAEGKMLESFIRQLLEEKGEKMYELGSKMNIPTKKALAQASQASIKELAESYRGGYDKGYQQGIAETLDQILKQILKELK